jgi:hypothetical protein
MMRLSREFRFAWRHFTSDLTHFEDAVFNGTGKRVLSVNNKTSARMSEFPNYRGTHFVRDPRDLIVSGYKYHLWTEEKWCRDPAFNWTSLVAHPYFARYIENDSSKFPANISYQTYLNRLDAEKGMILDLLWRQGGFEQMKIWNYHNERILEMKYEDIIGNETAVFSRIFEHYNFHPKLAKRGVEIVEEFSLKNQKKSPTGHVRKGTGGQWKMEFTPLVTQALKDLNGDLVIALGYEKDADW